MPTIKTFPLKTRDEVIAQLREALDSADPYSECFPRDLNEAAADALAFLTGVERSRTDGIRALAAPWRPIESAPKAGLQRILVWRDGRVEFAYWAVMVEADGQTLLGGWWWTDRLIRDSEPQPSHWMPLPPAPASRGEE